METVTNNKPKSASIPTELDNIPWNELDFSPLELTNLILATNWPKFLPVLIGRTITLRIIITIATMRRMVVTTLVSPAIMNMAANSTPKFQPKFMNQLMVRSNLFEISNPSGRPVGLGVLAFLSFFGLAAFATGSSATGVAGSALGTAFATGFALATAFAFAFGLTSVVFEAPPALSNNPI